MDIDTIRENYDLHERRLAEFPGYRREASERLTRLVSDTGRHHFIAWSNLGEAEADAAIEAELARFRELGQGFEWKLYSHDRPADLEERLRARGFAIGEEEAIMAFELAELAVGPAERGPFEIRRVEDRAQLADAASVHESVWKEDAGEILADLDHELGLDPERISIYVAYDGGEPVSSAWIRFPRKSPFASLWGGSTVESHRGRGIYGSLLALRAREARDRGYRWLTIDAGPLSRPIVERFGFRLLSLSRPCDSPTEGSGAVS